IFHAAYWPLGAGRAARTTESARKRPPHSRGGDGIRVGGRGHSGGPGARVTIGSTFKLGGVTLWPSLFSLRGGWFRRWEKASPAVPWDVCSKAAASRLPVRSSTRI